MNVFLNLVLWLLALAALAVGTGALTLTLIQAVPATWTWYHFRLRKPVANAVLLIALALGGFSFFAGHIGAIAVSIPLILVLIGTVLAHRLHQERAFPAVDFPAVARDPFQLPLRDDHQLALIEVEGISRAYPLDYVIHHHVVNDRFGDRIVALTFCAMCHTVIPFDVTKLGPLFVGSFREGNMIVADRRTGTFFQQASFESLIGPLHPSTLEMLPFQILSWEDVRQLDPMPSVAEITSEDLRDFELPIPGLWRRIMASEKTPGLNASRRDNSRSARTRVVGVIDPEFASQAWIKQELVDRGLIRSGPIYLVAVRNAVVAFRATLAGTELKLDLDNEEGLLQDVSTGRSWDLRGHPRGSHPALTPVAISDEYWFSWRLWHPSAELVELHTP